jgi:hypothetical protein
MPGHVLRDTPGVPADVPGLDPNDALQAWRPRSSKEEGPAPGQGDTHLPIRAGSDSVECRDPQGERAPARRPSSSAHRRRSLSCSTQSLSRENPPPSDAESVRRKPSEAYLAVVNVSLHGIKFDFRRKVQDTLHHP